MRLQVASYNIHRGFGRDGRYDPGRILRVLQEVNADIVALQEVDFPGRDCDQLLMWLAAQLGMTAVGGPVRRSEAGTYGNALLTRYPVKNVRRWDLSVGRHEPRGALAADMLCQGAMIHVVTTHLGLWPKERPLQTSRLLERLQITAEELTILMGDLNEWQLWGKSLRVLRRAFGSPVSPPTFPTVWPILALDRIWVSPPQALRGVQAHHSGQSLIASDHLPVKAQVCFRSAIHTHSVTA
ncbi:MAG: Endo/exonuclease/phosphatase domain-containing protein [Nitrospira sp.]|nr:MAG: Endo/exonuclease/phosphatase domain-containing protein [Nitrospira sp.]